MKSIDKFVSDKTGYFVANPDGSYKGQCVSLIQVYLEECLGVPYKPRGNAKDWAYSLVNEGLAYEVEYAQKGDVLVYNEFYGGGYGHITLYLGDGIAFDQNNLMNGRNGSAAKMAIFGVFKIFRTYKRPSEESIESGYELTSSGTLEFTYNEIRIRNGHDGFNSPLQGQVYNAGMVLNYDTLYEQGGHLWVTYTSLSGAERTIAVRDDKGTYWARNI